MSNQFEKYESKKQHRRLLVVSLRKQHRLFVREGLDDIEEDLSEKLNDLEHDTSYENWQDLSDVTNQFKLGVYLPIQVKPTERVMVYKNGVRQPHILMPGRRTLWNQDLFFTRYQIYRFNTQIVTLKALIDGRVHDSQMGLDLRVIAEFRILCRLKHFERFLFGVDKPLRLLYTIFNDIVYDELATLEHDLLGKWARELRDRVLKRLQGDSLQEGEVEKLIGIEVVNVFVDNLSNNPLYAKIQDENFGYKAELWRNVEKARAERAEASILGIDSSLIRFENTEMGRQAIEGEMDMEKIKIGLGMIDSTQRAIPAPSSQPLICPPVPTSPVTGPPSGDTASQSSEEKNDSVSEERQELEVVALKQAGFVTEGRGGRSGLVGAECWSISITTRFSNSYLLTITFRCDSNYPYRPPKVYIFSKEHGRREMQQLESLLNWDCQMMLVDIAEEVRHILSTEFAGGSQ